MTDGSSGPESVETSIPDPPAGADGPEGGSSRPTRAVNGLVLVGIVFVAVSGLARAFGFQTGVVYVVVTALGVAVAAVLAALEATSDRPPRNRAAVVGAVLGATAVLVGAFWVLRPPREPLEEMSGDLNIAVAEFGAGSDDEELERAARDLSTSLTAFLEAEAAEFRSEDTLVEILGPDDIGPIEGDDRVDRADHARDLAEEVNADVVLYGVLTADGAQTVLEPEFVLNDRRLSGALELTGHHTLGTPVKANGAPIDAQRSLRGDTRARIVALARFMVGLSYYRVEDHETARVYFAQARDDPAWKDEDGKELVYLFLGNVEGKLRNYGRADDRYEEALRLNPDFARAMIGQAELAYLRSFADEDPEGEACTPAVIDSEGLDAAIDRYRDATAAGDQPAISDIDLKAEFGIARVRLCQYLAGDRERAEDVSMGFGAVVAGYDVGRASVRSLASESYANLAALASTDPEQSGDELAVACEVMRLYESAVETSPSKDRRDLFEGNMANARSVVDRADESCPQPAE